MKWAFDVEGQVVIAHVPKAAQKPVELTPELQLPSRRQPRLLAADDACVEYDEEKRQQLRVEAERATQQKVEQERQERE